MEYYSTSILVDLRGLSYRCTAFALVDRTNTTLSGYRKIVNVSVEYGMSPLT